MEPPGNDVPKPSLIEQMRRLLVRLELNPRNEVARRHLRRLPDELEQYLAKINLLDRATQQVRAFREAVQRVDALEGDVALRQGIEGLAEELSVIFAELTQQLGAQAVAPLTGRESSIRGNYAEPPPPFHREFYSEIGTWGGEKLSTEHKDPED